MLKTANSDGYANQEAKILEAVQNGFKGYDLKPSQTASAAFFRTNDKKLNALIKATVSDLKRAETAILRMSNDKYRKAIFNAQVFANTGAGTYEKAVDMACRDMLRAGLNCVEYKNGARHTLSDYAEMALRTADKRAYLYGEGQKRQEWGIAAVIVNNRRGGCPHCAPYVGRVFIDDVYSGGNKSDGKYPLLSEAIRGGLFHPRCKDSTSTYFEGITQAKPVTKEELAEMDRREKLEQKQSYCKNEAKKNRRIAEHSLDPDNQKSYTHRAEVFEQKAAAVKKLQTDKITKKSSAVDSWESENYKNSTEKGLLITSDGNKIDFGGTDHHVTGRADDIKLMDGAVFTHNHPTDNTFSQNDIVTGLVKGNLKELRAVTSAGDVHILVNNGATEEQRKKFSAAYQQRRMKAANAADSKIRKGERINKDEYIKSRLEAFMSENAEDYNLTYVKSSIGKSEKPLANSGESGIIKADKKFEPLLPEKVVPTLRKESEKWLEKLTDEEIRSIKKYTKNIGDAPDDKFYAKLNAMLRGKIPENETLAYYSNQISNAISKFELKHDIVCYRTLDFDAYKKFDVGMFFKEPQFTSTSVVKSKVLNNPFLVKIHVPQKANGAYIETISEYPNQREFLIDKNAVFKVISKSKNSIELEMIV